MNTAQDTKSTQLGTENNGPIFYTFQEVMDMLKISRTHLYNLINEKGIKPIVIGKAAKRLTAEDVTKLYTREA